MSEQWEAAGFRLYPEAALSYIQMYNSRGSGIAWHRRPKTDNAVCRDCITPPPPEGLKLERSPLAGLGPCMYVSNPVA